MTSSIDPTGCTGFSRRTFFRFAAGASALATVPILTEAHLALAQRPHFADPNKGIHIDANENPLGPLSLIHIWMGTSSAPPQISTNCNTSLKIAERRPPRAT